MTIVNGRMLPQNIVKYTKNGCRLLSQTTVGSTKTTIIETDFGKGIKEVVQTFGYYKEFNNLTITHRDLTGKELQKLVRKHNYHEIETSIFDGENHLISSSIEQQRIETEKDGSKSLLRIKLKKHLGKGERYEEQSYEDLHNATNKDLNKTLYTTATRLNDGQVINKTISGNLQNLEKIAKDPYLHIRNYTDKEFTQSASYIAAEKQGVKRGRFSDRHLEGYRGAYNCFLKKVSVDSSHPKWDMIHILNHEYRHKYQFNQMNKLFLNIFKINNKKSSMTPTESKQAKAFLKASFNRKDPDIDFPGYYSNLLEVDANKAGKKAKTEYEDFTKKLAKAFNAEYSATMFGFDINCLVHKR